MVPPGAGLPPVAEHSAHGVAATAPGERGGGVVATLHLGGLVVVSGEERGHAGLPEAGQPGEDGLRWTRRSGSSGASPHRKSRTCACFEHTFESLSRQARLASPRTLRPCAEPSSTPDDPRFGPVPATAAGDGTWARAGDAVLTATRATGRTTSISWDLAWRDDAAPLYTFPRWAWRRQVLPAAQVVPVPTARVTGVVCGRPFDADGGTTGDTDAAAAPAGPAS